MRGIWSLSPGFPTKTTLKTMRKSSNETPTTSGLAYSSLPGKTRRRSQRQSLTDLRTSEPTWDLRGPAPRDDKLLWRELALRQVRERYIPPFLRNDIVWTTPRDKFGRIAVKRMTGVVPSPANTIVRKFEEVAGGREEILEKLHQMEDKLSPEEKHFVHLLETSGKQKGLARLMAEAGVKPSRILRLFADGAIALGKIQTAIEVSKNQPLVVKDLMRHALDQQGVCQTCVGTGMVKHKKNSTEETMKCPSCTGSGFRLRSSKHKEYAMEKVLQIGKLVEKPSSGRQVSVEVQQNVGVAVGRGGGFVERVLKTSDEVLYGRKRLAEPEVIDVSPEGDRSEPEEA